MPPRLDLSGRRFGKLTAIRRSHQDSWNAWMWLCQCDCGAHVIVRGSTLAAGRTSACHSCAATASATTHGQSDTPLYARWRAMIERTRNPNNPNYANYGGRGIAVCERWLEFVSFAADMGPAFATELTLERRDVNGGYSPENCYWATTKQQTRNRRNNHVVEWRGRQMVVTDWAEMLGLKANTLIYRLRRGWPVERALTKGADPDVLLKLANQPEAAAR